MGNLYCRLCECKQTLRILKFSATSHVQTCKCSEWKFLSLYFLYGRSIFVTSMNLPEYLMSSQELLFFLIPSVLNVFFGFCLSNHPFGTTLAYKTLLHVLMEVLRNKCFIWCSRKCLNVHLPSKQTLAIALQTFLQ